MKNGHLPKLVNLLPSGAVFVSPDERLIFNRAVENIIGYSPDEIGTLADWFGKLYGEAGSGVARGHHDEDRKLGFQKSRLSTISRHDGYVRQIEVTAVTVEDGGEIWSLTDVSEKVAAQERLRFLFEEGRRIERRLRHTAEVLEQAQSISKVGSFEIDQKTGRREWSAQAAMNLGLPHHVGMAQIDFLNLIHPDDMARVKTNWHQAVKAKTDFEDDFRIARADGSIINVHARARMICDTAGELLRIFGTLQDVLKPVSQAVQQPAPKLRRAK